MGDSASMTLSASGSPIAFYGASEDIADGCNYLSVCPLSHPYIVREGTEIVLFLFSRYITDSALW